MNARTLIATRAIAWVLAIGAVAAVAVGYDSLPDMLPVTRWTDAPKSMFIALRVPVVNLLTLGLAEVLSPGIRRATDLKTGDAIEATLLLTAAAKACLEAIGILLLPASTSWSVAPLAAVLVIGLGMTALLGRGLRFGQQWRKMQMTRPESAAALAIVIGMVVLNLPLAFR
jgi:hypothetical protein